MIPTPVPTALTITGSGGGGRIKADWKSFSARGVYGASVMMAVPLQIIHGIGGRLTASITAGLAKNSPLGEAMREANNYLQVVIAAANGMGVGSGHDPVHHSYSL